jgi:hypothetical protein
MDGLLMKNSFECELDSHIELLYKKCSNIVHEVAAISNSDPTLGDLAERINRQLLSIIYRLTNLQDAIYQAGKANVELLDDFEIYNMITNFKEALVHIENKLAINKHCVSLAEIICIDELRERRSKKYELEQYIRSVINSFDISECKHYVLTGYFNYIVAILIRKEKLEEEQAREILTIVKGVLDEKKQLGLTNPSAS